MFFLYLDFLFMVWRMDSAEDDQDIAGLDGGADGNANFLNGTGGAGEDLVLHLHSLEDDDGVIGTDGIADLAVDLGDGAVHRSGNGGITGGDRSSGGSGSGGGSRSRSGSGSSGRSRRSGGSGSSNGGGSAGAADFFDFDSISLAVNGDVELSHVIFPPKIIIV